MIPLMPSLVKGTHAFHPSQHTTGVAGLPQAGGSMGPPITQRAMHDSDDDIPPDSMPPCPPSASLPSSITSSQKRKCVAFDSVSESFASTSFGSGSKDKKQHISGGAAGWTVLQDLQVYIKHEIRHNTCKIKIYLPKSRTAPFSKVVPSSSKWNNSAKARWKACIR